MNIIGKLHAVLNMLNIWYLRATRPNLTFEANVKIDWKTRILIGKNKLIIGENSTLRSRSANYHAGMPFGSCILIDIFGAIVKIGKNCRINGTYIHSQESISIGNNCVIASGVNIIDSNGHRVNSTDRTIGRDKPEAITIGNNVWIGLNATILKGTTIGFNSIVTTGSVVKGNFPANVIIQGNPAVIAGELNIK